MIPLIAAAVSLAEYAPTALKWLGLGDKSVAVAQDVVDLAKRVTGKDDANEAAVAFRNDPTLALQYQQLVAQQEQAYATMVAANAADINATMRAETASEHWPSYSWRPFIGACFGLAALIAVLTSAAAYIGVMFNGMDPKVLEHLPGMLGAIAGTMATMAPVLGIASWFRGKAQVDGAVPLKG